jgi:tryptophan synthase alpha chain
MGRIEDAFARARRAGRAAFIPYVTAGDPDDAATRSLVRALAEEGADVLELGVPFSDPLADGPTIQRACERALRGGMTLRRALVLAGAIRDGSGIPIVLFTYVNPILRMGIDAFAGACRAAGVDGVLATDLPAEEAEDLRRALSGRGVRLVPLLAPTSGPERIAAAAGPDSGFIYYICRTGVTGERDEVPPGLRGEVEAVRRGTGLPVAVGFGIGTADQVRAVGAFSDGVVVGSALVRAVEEGRDDPEAACRAAVRRLLGRG